MLFLLFYNKLFDFKQQMWYNVYTLKVWGPSRTIQGVEYMKTNYIFEYLDENDFRKKERSVRKYNMLAYKKLTFTYYPELRKGKFLGNEVRKNDILIVNSGERFTCDGVITSGTTIVYNIFINIVPNSFKTKLSSLNIRPIIHPTIIDIKSIIGNL